MELRVKVSETMRFFRVKKHWTNYMILLILFLVTSIFSFKQSLHWDELIYLDASTYTYIPRPENSYAFVKLGHYALLSLLVLFTGQSLNAFYALRTTFAIITFSFILVVYSFAFMFMKSNRLQSLCTALILIVSPMIIYLNARLLAEIPSILIALIGCFILLLGFKKRKYHLSLVSGFVSFLGFVFRVTALITYVSFVVSLVTVDLLSKKKRRIKKGISKSPITFLKIGNNIVWYALGSAFTFGLSFLCWVGLYGFTPFLRFYSVAVESGMYPTYMVGIYGFYISVSILNFVIELFPFVPFALLSLIVHKKDALLKTSCLWVALSSLPIIFIISPGAYFETRQGHFNIVPLSILSAFSLAYLSKHAPKIFKKKRIKKVSKYLTKHFIKKHSKEYRLRYWRPYISLAMLFSIITISSFYLAAYQPNVQWQTDDAVKVANWVETNYPTSLILASRDSYFFIRFCFSNLQVYQLRSDMDVNTLFSLTANKTILLWYTGTTKEERLWMEYNEGLISQKLYSLGKITIYLCRQL